MSLSNNLLQELDKELRGLSASHRSKIAEILDGGGAWKNLASILPKPGQKNSTLLSTTTIDLLERQLYAGKSPTIELLNHWSICGRRRPTIRTLLIYLDQAQIKRAVDYVCKYILKVESVNELTSQQDTISAPGSSIDRQIDEHHPLSTSIRSDTSSFDMITDAELHSDIGSANLSGSRTDLLSYSSDATGYVRTNPKCSSDVNVLEHDIEEIFLFHNLSDFQDHINSECQRFSFESIYLSTNGFCHKPYDFCNCTGTMIGEGKFSRVFRAKARPLEPIMLKEKDEKFIAAKLLKSECNEKLLVNEIDLIRRMEHENILKFLGISIGNKDSVNSKADLHYLCLVYEFMENGSLLDRLACKHNSKPIVWTQRLSIAIGIARGISYLHTTFAAPIIHRDIKSANIFLDKNLNPKVGDFTLIRQLEANVTSNNSMQQDIDSNKQLQTQMTQNVMGTSIYMPAEAFRGDISIKLDTFSFGVVMLELISGMKPFDEERQEDIFTYITEEIADMDEQIESNPSYDSLHYSGDMNAGSLEPTLSVDSKDQKNNLRMLQEKGRDKFLKKILDRKAGEWDFSIARSMFRVALLSTENKKKIRPKMTQVLPMLEGLKYSIIK